MNATNLIPLIAKLKESPVLIVGDAMLDHYQFGRVERISPEAPVPVVTVEREEYKLGGACNVARNLRQLGGRPKLISVCGDCGREERLQQQLDFEGIDFDFIQENARTTTIKTRIIAHNQQVVRVDHETPVSLKKSSVAKILSAIEREKDNFPVIILSDYGKGVICPELMKGLRQMNSRSAPKIIVDPKVKNYDLYKETFLLTPNATEASQGAGMEIFGREDVLKAGIRLFKRLRCTHLVITLGPEGMAFFESPDKVWRIPTVARKVYDVTGAGDTVIATIGLGFSAGLELKESCILSNYAAGIVVGQIGTAAVTPEELEASIANLPPTTMEPWLVVQPT
ncbi:MAG: bifunctional heptose 7-phosphate kinase/heptose 1-phosphate adenyltransferase [Desulfovibrionales bacterium]